MKINIVTKSKIDQNENKIIVDEMLNPYKVPLSLVLFIFSMTIPLLPQ